jgi:hypothetical protein
MGMLSASPRAGGASGSDQDCDKLVGLALDRGLDVQQDELVQEPEPIERLAELLGGQTYLVNKVCTTLGMTRFLVVGACRCCGPDHLKPDVPRHRAFGQGFHNANYCSGPVQQPLGYVIRAPVAISHGHPPSVSYRGELRAFRIPVPVLCSLRFAP